MKAKKRGALESLLAETAALYQRARAAADEVHGDLGVSAIPPHEPVMSVIGERFINTLFLAAYAAVIAVPIMAMKRRLPGRSSRPKVTKKWRNWLAAC